MKFSYQQTPVVYTLIAINVVCFVLFGLSSLNVERYFALYFSQNEAFGYYQYITHMFMHAGPLHLLFNMLGLWIFGMALERALGSRRFLIFYMLAGIGAGLIQNAVMSYEFSELFAYFRQLGLSPEQIQQMLDTATYRTDIPGLTAEKVGEFYTLYHTPMVGASGAIYGVLVAFAMCYPNTKMIFLFIPYPIAAKYFVPVILAIDLFSGVTGFSIFGGGIAHFAHLGGAFMGFLLFLYFRAGRF